MMNYNERKGSEKPELSSMMIHLLGANRNSPVQEGKSSVNRRRKYIKLRNEKGQGLVEFALVIPILLLLMLGIFEFGYFFFVYSSVNTAAREAARYGAGTGKNGSGDPYYMDCTGIRDRAKAVGMYAGITDGDVTIFYDTGPSSTSLGNCDGVIEPQMGERIVVQVEIYYQPIILTGIFPVGGVPIHSESARTIIHRMQVGG